MNERCSTCGWLPQHHLPGNECRYPQRWRAGAAAIAAVESETKPPPETKRPQATETKPPPETKRRPGRPKVYDDPRERLRAWRARRKIALAKEVTP